MATYSVLLLLSPRWWMVCLGYTCSTKTGATAATLAKILIIFLQIRNLTTSS